MSEYRREVLMAALKSRARRYREAMENLQPEEKVEHENLSWPVETQLIQAALALAEDQSPPDTAPVNKTIRNMVVIFATQMQRVSDELLGETDQLSPVDAEFAVHLQALCQDYLSRLTPEVQPSAT